MQSSSHFFSYATKPALMVFQKESLLLKFTPNTRLPINLETNHVRTCACLSIYSPEKGIAYLSHIDPNALDDNHFHEFISHLENIIDKFSLNKNNTFVSLVGGQDRSLEKSAEYHKGIHAIRNFLNIKFENIHENLGGDNKTERCIELSADFLKFVTFDLIGNVFWLHSKQTLFCDGNVKLEYQQKKIPFNVNKKGELLEINYFNHHKIFFSFPNEMINIINDSYTPPSQYTRIVDAQRKSMLERCKVADLHIENTNIYLNKTVSKLVNTFDLNTNPSLIITHDIYSCMIQYHSLIIFLKKHLEFDEFIKLDFTKINNLRLCSIKKMIEEKIIKPEQVYEMTNYANTILKNKNHYTLLMNNMKIEEILKLTNNNKQIKEILSMLDSLIESGMISAHEIQHLNFDDVRNIYNQKQSRNNITDETIEIDINHEPVTPVQEKYLGCPISF